MYQVCYLNVAGAHNAWFGTFSQALDFAQSIKEESEEITIYRMHWVEDIK